MCEALLDPPMGGDSEGQTISMITGISLRNQMAIKRDLKLASALIIQVPQGLLPVSKATSR